MRARSKDDERVVVVSITEEGEKLHDLLSDVPTRMAQCVKLENEEAMQLYTLLNKMIKRSVLKYDKNYLSRKNKRRLFK